MAEKSQIIILNSIKYKDYNIIIQGYSEQWGKQSYILSLPKGSKKRTQYSQLHPLSVIEASIESNYKKEMRRIYDFGTVYNLINIRSDIRKNAIAIFIAEFVNKAITGEEKNDSLFGLLITSILQLESIEEDYANLHTHFVVNLSKILGYAPENNYSERECLFNMPTAKFVSNDKADNECLSLSNSKILHKLIASKDPFTRELQLTGLQRYEFLNEFLLYIKYHLGQNLNIQSLKVLHDVFEAGEEICYTN